MRKSHQRELAPTGKVGKVVRAKRGAKGSPKEDLPGALRTLQGARGLTVPQIRALQHTVGNRAVQGLAQRRFDPEGLASSATSRIGHYAGREDVWQRVRIMVSNEYGEFAESEYEKTPQGGIEGESRY